MSSKNTNDIEKELIKLGYWENLYSKNNYFGSGPTLLAKSAELVLRENFFKKILELGCGQGRDCLFFAELGYNVTAIDISEKAIDSIKKIKIEKNLTNLELQASDIQNSIKLFNAQFDLIYSNLALQFFQLDELENIFLDISKIMTKNSLFLFSTKKSGDKYYDFGNKLSDFSFEYRGIIRYFYSKTELQSILSKYFEIISFEDEKHTNNDNTVSVWWKILVRKCQ